MDRLRSDYEGYLRKQRGLAESTICHCTRFMERFMAFRFGDKLGDLNAITPNDIVAFICHLKAGSHPCRQKAVPTHLRSLFKFLFWSGKTKRDLAISLPRAATASDHLPRYLKPEEIQQLIESVGTDDAIGRRQENAPTAKPGSSRIFRDRDCPRCSTDQASHSARAEPAARQNGWFANRPYRDTAWNQVR